MKYLLTLTVTLFSFQAFCQGQFQQETAGSVSFASGQIMMLAQAIPSDKYSWTPQTGVRNAAQVCAHVVSANYFFASKLGAKIPEGVKMETLEADLKTKEDIAAELKRSFEVVITAIKNTSDASLKTKVEFPFPGEYTQMTACLIVVAHANEHLGQLIAYARSNNIVPPWNDKK
ncbi:MAG: DinB family protein [Bacteroidota bacterium]